MISLVRCKRGLLLFCCCALPAVTFGQGLDIEPNNTCPIAQDIGSPTLPFALSGELQPVGSVADIDFFHFTGVPGELLRADLQGAWSEVGTLGDPLLGLFDEDCNLIGLNDDAGSPDARLLFAVPPAGNYVLAATANPDYSFTGAGEGSYLLTVSRAQIVESIFGRLVNERDGIPLSGEFPTYASAQLFGCTGGYCSVFIGFQNADSEGNFHFDMELYGNPLLAGTYQLQAFANGFEALFTDTFEVLENEAFDLGDIALKPYVLIGSVSGRLIDALDGTPLPGSSSPFGVTILERCEEYGCYGTSYAASDENGRFRFEGILNYLAPGMYRITAFADDYQQTTTAQFLVSEFEEFYFGDIALTPAPIQFGAILGCEIPPGGGPCEYGLEIRNRGPGRFKGEAWSTVEFYSNEFPYRQAQFQTGKVGTVNPMPERLNLRAGQNAVLQFQFDVPRSVPDWSTMCATATVGRYPNPQFHNSGDRFLFCAVMQPDGFRVLSDKEGRKLMRELKQQQNR